MSTGFVQRFKGKIAIAWKGIFQGGGQSVAVFWNHGAPVNGGSGTFAGIAPPGALLATDEPAFYQNTNTQASPTWTAAPLTGAAGITSGTIDGASIGGVTPAAGTFTTLTATGEVKLSEADTLTASTTHTQGGATAITKQVSRFSVVANAGDSGVLPAATAGDFRVVINDGAHAMQVYGNGSDTIDGVAGATGVPLTNAKRAIFFCLTAGAWQSISSGVSA